MDSMLPVTESDWLLMADECRESLPYAWRDPILKVVWTYLSVRVPRGAARRAHLGVNDVPLHSAPEQQQPQNAAVRHSGAQFETRWGGDAVDVPDGGVQGERVSFSGVEKQGAIDVEEEKRATHADCPRNHAPIVGRYGATSEKKEDARKAAPNFAPQSMSSNGLGYAKVGSGVTEIMPWASSSTSVIDSVRGERSMGRG